ncbi:MAG TPA: hypothetical protein VL727_21075 [Puia sp.]|nr:hypothetical protein [Puia sp.]
MRTIVSVLLLGISTLVFGQQGANRSSGVSRQQLIGVWQEGSATVGDALRKNFQFFSDGRFVLNFSQYNDISAVRGLGGQYRLDSSGLFLIADYRKEIVGGTFEKGNPGVESEEFVLTGGKLQTIRQKPDSDSYVDPYLISPCKPEKKAGGHPCVVINYNTYYKLNDNPQFYDKKK